MVNNSELGIYVHVPFCRSKCPYCDFYSFAADENIKKEYALAVSDELKTLRRSKTVTDADMKSRPVTTVYFGGGTPSELGGEYISSILGDIKDNFRLEAGAEITAECNPSSRGLDLWLGEVSSAGVNRISFGIQSAADTERKALGRISDRDEIERVTRLIRKNGIDNISADVMLGIPGQTKKTLFDTLSFVVSLGIDHVSCYMLKIEENTFFGRNRDKLTLPDDDETADLYLMTCGFLRENGYERYEISNFCRGGRYSRHNTACWQGREYLGIGAAAHSFVDGKRFFYPRSAEAFINGTPPEYDGPGGGADEYIMLGLRLSEGISASRLAAFGITPGEEYYALVGRLAAAGLAVPEGERVSLTDEGALISNTVIRKICESLNILL